MVITHLLTACLMALALLNPLDSTEQHRGHTKLPLVRMVLDESRYGVPPEPTEPEPVEQIEPTEPEPADPTPSCYQDDRLYRDYYGRLYVPDAGIDVALYYDYSQAVCDRQDSATIFGMKVFDGLYIADHNNQEFRKLRNVRVGMRGYILHANGTRLDIVCTEVTSGHNTGVVVEDENGVTNFDADYLMYTCKDNWHNILICLWKYG